MGTKYYKYVLIAREMRFNIVSQVAIEHAQAQCKAERLIVRFDWC